MDIDTAKTLGLGAIRSIDHVRANRIAYPPTRVGTVLVNPEGDHYTVYRETSLTDETTSEGVILVFRIAISNAVLGTKIRFALYHRLANVATPFFAGLPGFRRKLWLAGEGRGDFLELYEWATEEDAQRLITVLDTLLGPVDDLGSATYEIAPYESIDTFVDGTPFEWQTAADVRTRKARRYLVLVAAFMGAGYLAWSVINGLRETQEECDVG